MSHQWDRGEEMTWDGTWTVAAQPTVGIQGAVLAKEARGTGQGAYCRGVGRLPKVEVAVVRRDRGLKVKNCR